VVIIQLIVLILFKKDYKSANDIKNDIVLKDENTIVTAVFGCNMGVYHGLNQTAWVRNIFALQTCNIAKSGQLKLTNGQWCDVDFFMEILFKWLGEKLNIPSERMMAFPLLNLSLTCKSW